MYSQKQGGFSMKKWIMGIAAFVMMAVLCVVSAGAEIYGDYKYFVLDDDTVKITDYTGSATELEIPAEIDGRAVTSIGDYAFEDSTSLTSVTIPDSVTIIGYCAFYDCASLTSVTIPDSVTVIGWGAFSGCTSLTSITIPDSVTIIGSVAFYGCTSLTSVTIPDSVTSIGEDAFYDTAILNNQTTDIKYVDKWVVECNDIETAVIKDGTIGIAGSAFFGCKSLTTITIPDSVTSIGDDAFFDCGSLTSVTIPDSVTSIGSSAFLGCTSLTSITIPDSVTSIGDDAFNSCTSLATVTIPDSVTSIGWQAFMNCTSLTSVTIPDSVTSIGDYAFNGCTSLTSVTIPDSVTSIGDYAFGYYNANTDTFEVAYFTINCYENSTAHKYAVDNGIEYKLITVTAPTAVEGLSLGGRSGNALRLNWTKNDTADGYIIEMYKGGKWTRIARIAGNATTTYRVTGLAADTAYKFRMRAYAMDGTTALYSAYTSTLAARTNPSNVAGFKLGGRASNALRLNWTKNDSADGYIVEQYKGGKWIRVAKITSNATTTYRVTGLTASTQYKFRVKAYKMSGKTALYSGYTSTLAAYTNPSAVSNLKITGKAGTALRLGWSKNTSADGYIVEMYSGGKWVRVAKLTSNATITYRKAGLAKGTTYKFRVATYNMVGKTALYGAYVNVSGTTL